MPRMGLSGSHSGPCARCASTTRSKNKLFKHHAASIRWPFAGFSGLWRRHIMRSMPLYRRLEPNAQLLEYRCMEFVEEFLWGNLRKQQLVKRWEGETIIVEARGAALAQTSSLVLTIRVGQQPAQQCRSRKIGLWICGFRYFDGPQRPVNAGQIGLFGYAFIPDEFRPCADRSVRRFATTIASQCSLSAVSTGVLLSPAL